MSAGDGDPVLVRDGASGAADHNGTTGMGTASTGTTDAGTAIDSLVVAGDIASLPKVIAYARAAAAKAGLEPRDQYRLRLAIDELATNIVIHGYEEHGDVGSIEVSARIDNEVLTICLRDSARAYDPTVNLQREEAQLSNGASLLERSEGGLGLYLVAHSVDDFAYSYEDGQNCNRLKIFLTAIARARSRIQIAHVAAAAGLRLREALETALAGPNYSVTWAVTWLDNADDLRASLSQQTVDLLLIDIELSWLSKQLYSAVLDELQSLDPHAALQPPAVILVYGSGDEDKLPARMDDSVLDVLSLSLPTPIIQSRLGTLVERVRQSSELKAAQQRMSQLERLRRDLTEFILPLGVALSKEDRLDLLMERIITEAMSICRADGGTLYIKTADDTLEFSIMRTDSLGLAFGGSTGKSVPHPPLPLFDPVSGEPNHRNAATSAALHKQSINVADVYAPSNVYDFSGAKEFDDAIGYHTHSCLTVPMLVGGELIGVLQVLNARHAQTGRTVPFGSYEQQVIESLASQAAVALHNRKLMRDREHLLRMEAEMDAGRQIQESFLPAHLPTIPGWQIAACMRPARMVSGDFYDAFVLGHRCLGLVIADVCDKGIGAALFMGLIRSLLRAYTETHWYMHGAQPWSETDAHPDGHAVPGRSAATIAGPGADPGNAPGGNPGGGPSASGDSGAEIWLEPNLHTMPDVDPETLAAQIRHTLRQTIHHANNYIAHTHDELYMFATLFFGLLIPESGQLYYVNCGHPPLYLCRGEGGIRTELTATGPAVGVFPNVRFDVAEEVMAPRELLLGYTDGITDARNAEGQRFGPERLRQFFDHPLRSAAELTSDVERAIDSFTGEAAQFDDIAVLTVLREW